MGRPLPGSQDVISQRIAGQISNSPPTGWRPTVEGPLRRRVYPSHGPSSFPHALPPSFSQDSTSLSGAVSVTVSSAPHAGHLNRRRGSGGWTCSVGRARGSSRPTSSMRCPHLSHGRSMAIGASLAPSAGGRCRSLTVEPLFLSLAHRTGDVLCFRLTCSSPLPHRLEPHWEPRSPGSGSPRCA